MNFLQSKKRLWLDLFVGTVLLCLIGFGSVYIYRLNNDAREVSFNTEQAMRGQQVSTNRGCIACHTIDGSAGVGPSWLNMWGSTETLVDGSLITVNASYFEKSLSNPGAQVVAGYPDVMLRYFLEDEEILDLMEFARSLSGESKGSE